MQEDVLNQEFCLLVFHHKEETEYFYCQPSSVILLCNLHYTTVTCHLYISSTAIFQMCKCQAV